MIDRWLQACDQNHLACDVDAYAQHVASVGPRPCVERYEEESVSRFVKLVISSKSRQESRAAFEGLRAWAKRMSAAPTRRNQPADAGRGEGTKTYHPTRLIDVGSIDQHREPRLVLESECPLGARCLALSHCWGLQSAHPVPQTVKDNYGTHRAEITFTKLPKTFQDTIVFARKLHIHYVWIDSFCIIQDDADDWEKESARMGDVYKNAYCTLAASASSNSSEGLFHQRSFDDGLKPASLDLELPSHNGIDLAKVVISPPLRNPRVDVTRAILTTRAWTMQERALSRRIVHFTKTRLVWECRTCTLDDTSPEDEKKYTSAMPLTWYQDGETIRDSSDTRTVSEYCANLWRTLMQYFSGRDITYEKDTFPAVSGLAKTLQPFIGGRYFAGIWENDVLNGLAWKLSDRYDFRTPDAPEPKYEGSYSPS
ncbi:Ff.00g084800.m01.CDS01 [Fusarium sp. VM40]|nr:Ff.00g084800.m01.CDS01 [Fusarium sp. VM40]